MSFKHKCLVLSFFGDEFVENEVDFRTYKNSYQEIEGPDLCTYLYIVQDLHLKEGHARAF
jgi:hypothetical protein